MRLSTESIRQHCDSGWYPLEAWCLQYNQHIDKRLLHPVIESAPSNFAGGSSTANEELFGDNDTTPTSESTPSLQVVAVDSLPRKTPIKKRRTGADVLIGGDTNPFRAVFAQSKETHSFGSPSKSARSNRNPFEKLSKRSGKVLDDGEDVDELSSLEDNEKSFGSPMDQQKDGGKQMPNIGAWTAGVVGSSSKLQAIHKWFKSENNDSRPESPKKRGDLSDLASVSVRDLVRAIGVATPADQKANGNSGTDPISIPSRISPHSSSSKSVEVSEASGLQNSLDLSDTKEVSNFIRI